jgi:type IV pilus assembly protein PilA
MNRMQKGFTLIELMIVVAIIGILAAVAIPQYQNYTIRAKLSNATSSLESVKLAMADFFQTNGSFPTAFGTAAGQLGINAPTAKELSGVSIAGSSGTAASIVGTLTGVKATVIDGTTITFSATPAAGDSTLRWAAAASSTEPVVVEYIKKVSGS